MIDDVGDPGGAPVVYLHGGGDSRLSRHPDDAIASSLGVRLLAVDRCGPARRFATLRAWAEATLVELPVERFAVLGWSAGGPHALALAAVAPERVTRVAVVGSMPPPDLVSQLPQDVRTVMRVARWSPYVAARGLERWGRQPVAATGDAATDEAYTRGRAESFSAGGLCSRASSPTSAVPGASTCRRCARPSRSGGAIATRCAHRRSPTRSRSASRTPSCTWSRAARTS